MYIYESFLLSVNIKKLSLFKAISWRIFGSLISFFIVFILSGDFTVSLNFSILECFLKIAGYYIHDCIWDKFFNSLNGQKKQKVLN